MKTLLLIVIIFFASLTYATPFFLGDWHQDCTIMGEDDVVKNFMFIDSELMDQVVIVYEKENCVTPYLIFKRQYQVGKPNPADQIKTDIDMAVIKVSYTTLTDEVTEALNLVEFCGHSDWVTFQEKIVTGKTCQDYKAPASGTVEKFHFTTKTKSELFVNDDPTPYYKLMP